MAKLLTSHDRFHFHALLGLSALLHFIYRFAILLSSGRDSFTPSLITAATLAVHFLLHATSFQFKLPEKRMASKPMIWREFRLHNAIFAYRHLICTTLGVWMPHWWYMASPAPSALAVKISVLCLTCWAAEKATVKLGSQDDRTTNAMPYPPNTPSNLESTIKKFYAKSQFAATALAVFGTPMLSFGSVFAIEIASFLMTLVRKGKIESWQYHAAYTASLFLMLPAMVATLYFSGDTAAETATFRALCTMKIAVELRLNFRSSKYATWILSPLLGCAMVWVLPLLMDLKVWAFLGMSWSALDTLKILVRAPARPTTMDKQSTAHGRGGCSVRGIFGVGL